MNKVSLAPSGLPCIAGSMYEDFGEIRADVTDRLTHAVTDRSVSMHTPVVATADADARVMVLRGVERGGWLLRFHTDARAPKVAAILRDPRIAVLGYDKQAKIQLRMRGRARIERDGARVEEAWAESTNFARRCYLGDAPGQSSPVPTSGLPEAFETSEPADAQLVPARPNFALLMVEVEEIDWFSLAHSGHRRALLTPDEARWIAP